jgi:hypothetical protein
MIIFKEVSDVLNWKRGLLLTYCSGNKLKTKKYHTVDLVHNPNRNKLKTKKYHTVGLV